MKADDDREYVDFLTARLPRLRALAYYLCGDWHRADDVLQNAMTQLYVHWKRARAANDIDQYVRAMVVKSFLNEKRKSWSARVRLVEAVPESRASRIDNDIENQTVLRTALEHVPPRQRAVLVLRFLCDLTTQETADVLGCSAGTVKSQTSHGLTRLREVLGERPVTTTEGAI